MAGIHVAAVAYHSDISGHEGPLYVAFFQLR